MNNRISPEELAALRERARARFVRRIERIKDVWASGHIRSVERDKMIDAIKRRARAYSIEL